MQTYSVLVPREGTDAARMIDRASAVVSDGRESDGQVLVWFEGNRHKACNLENFHSRTVCAAGRIAVSYPTIAKALLPKSEFVEAAAFSYERLAFTEVADPDALTAWAGESIEEIVGERLEPGSYRADRWPPKEQISYLARMAGGVMAFRSRSGQAMLAGDGGFEVLADEDPRAAELFAPMAARAS